MKTFEVGYKSYYHETSDWCSDLITAKTEKEALRKFAKLHRIKKPDLSKPHEWKWWDGDWYMSFAYVKPVTKQRCPLCGGNGEVALA
jgi:hypothetical protein